MIDFIYKQSDKETDAFPHLGIANVYVYVEDNEATLKDLFKAFIGFTEKVGYTTSSWENIVLELSENIKNGYSICDWMYDAD